LAPARHHRRCRLFDLFLCLIVYLFPVISATEHPQDEIAAPPRPIYLRDSLGLDDDDFDFDVAAQDAFVGEVDSEPSNGYGSNMPEP